MSATYQPEFHGVGFHWREGLHFKRRENGDVEFSIREYPTAQRLGLDYHGDEPDDHNPTWTIPAAEWLSIIAAVSRDGSTSETYAAAKRFHEGAFVPTGRYTVSEVIDALIEAGFK